MIKKLFNACLIGLLVFPGGCVKGSAKEAAALGREASHLMQEEKYNEAIILVEKAEKLDPKNFSYSIGLAFAYNKTGQFEKAKSKYLEILPKLREAASKDDSKVIEVILVLMSLRKQGEAQNELEKARERFGEKEIYDSIEEQILNDPNYFEDFVLPKEYL